MPLTITEFALPSLRAADLIGTWHIVQTTFPMWRNGKNTRPTLNYRQIDATTLDDLVEYEKRGATKQIRGVDTQDPELSCHFTWRGRGLLALLSSDWYVVDLDREAQIMAIYFSKTLFTPAGLDLASISPTPDPAAIQASLARVRRAAVMRPHVDDLVQINHPAA
ncbi:hypothetical protein [Enhygromyxa salina]|uniref:Lipocalin-like domain-containing protein n=1 Tax=Enhygromyxa salina TaxID=215803 RepID=A0A2S9YMH8_9BACT|nr:hypothetical protein [Enhygromyxa salina]PRQ06289.1 hypothetical protein ENSA7_39660 [Enhygromyxa salina]